MAYLSDGYKQRKITFMKRTLLLLLSLIAVSFVQFSQVSAQPCTPNPIYTAPGIYPSDTMPDLLVGNLYSHVVDFVFPDDTTILGQTIAFDSFVVASVIAFVNCF